MVDSDLAEMYGGETKNLNKAVKRNLSRFPERFHVPVDCRRIRRFEIPKWNLKPTREDNMNHQYIFYFALIIMMSGCTDITRTKTYLMPPKALGMEEVAPNLFVNKEMSILQRSDFLRTVTEARKKISSFYGGIFSEPQILACSTEECFVGIGGRQQRGLHIGKSKILISPRGLTIPILTHEWSHAELSTRMGARMDGVFGIPSIPTWFDEGLAVAVSEEPAHSEKVWEQIAAAKMTTPKLEDLVSLNQWNRAAKKFGDVDFSIGIPGKICVVYATAGHEVRKWLQYVGRDGLLKLIERVKVGEDFNSTFPQSQLRRPL
jgi:hypothetical protein